MNEEQLTTDEWLKKELEFINNDMAHTLNGKLKAQLISSDDAVQGIVLKFPLENWLLNGLGTLHGGMSSAMMDLTMSMAVFCFSRGHIPPTISMTTNYLRPVPMEGYILVRARVTSLGKRNATAYSEVIIPSTKKTGCTAIGTYAII